jgi:hypothetical protein
MSRQVVQSAEPPEHVLGAHVPALSSHDSALLICSLRSWSVVTLMSATWPALLGGGVEVVERGDLGGEPTQPGRVVPGPLSDGAITGPPVAGCLDSLFPGHTFLVCGVRVEPQVAAFSGLTAGHAERGSDRGPADSTVAGRADEQRLPCGELLLDVPQFGERCDHLLGVDGVWSCSDWVLGIGRELADRLFHGGDRG